MVKFICWYFRLMSNGWLERQIIYEAIMVKNIGNKVV